MTCRATLPSQIQTNSASMNGQSFELQIDNDPKHTKKRPQEFLKARTM